MLRSRRDLTIAALAITALTLTACGGDDSSTTATEPAAVETTAAAPDTTVAETTVVEETVVEETVAPETTEAAGFVEFTSDDLVAALPTLADLGDGWTDSGQTVLIDPAPREGNGVGTCAGLNGAARAAANNVTALVISPAAIGTDQRRAFTSIYAFADETTAQAFIDLSADAANCPDGVTWEWIQKANPTAENEYNGFGPGFEDVTENQVWAFTETANAQYGDTEDVMDTAVERSRELTAANITFRQTDTTLTRYDRYDNVVIVTTVAGTWGQEGYINADQLVNYQPTLDDLDAYSAIVVPLVLERLGWE